MPHIHAFIALLAEQNSRMDMCLLEGWFPHLWRGHERPIAPDDGGSRDFGLGSLIVPLLHTHSSFLYTLTSNRKNINDNGEWQDIWRSAILATWCASMNTAAAHLTWHNLCFGKKKQYRTYLTETAEMEPFTCALLWICYVQKVCNEEVPLACIEVVNFLQLLKSLILNY